MSYGSGILDDISRHVRGCTTCMPLRPSGLADDLNTQLAIKQCRTYAQLHLDWRRWMRSGD